MRAAAHSSCFIPQKRRLWLASSPASRKFATIWAANGAERLSLAAPHAHLGFEGNPRRLENATLHLVDERLHVGRRRITRVHDEAGVLGGNLGASDRKSLKPRLIDERCSKTFLRA